MAPTYTMLLGGSSGENGELGRTIMRVPAKRVIEVILKIIEIYKEERDKNESLDNWIRRIVNGVGLGKVTNFDDLKSALSEVARLASIVEDPDAYHDYGNDSNFVAKTARGECAA
jgi:sulfite reductase (ferredoxin)